MGSHAAAWDIDQPILASIYNDDTIESPFAEACRRLPHRTPNTISNRASISGVAAARRKRNGLPEIVGSTKPRGPRTDRLTPEEKALRAQDRRSTKRASYIRRRDERRVARAELKAKIKAERTKSKDDAKSVAAAKKARDAAFVAVAKANKLVLAAGLSPMSMRGGSPAPVQADKPVPAERVCDLGEREYIRRRLTHTISTLAGELQCHPSDVAAAVTAIVKDGFNRQNLMTGYVLTDLEPTAGRTFKGRGQSRER